MKSKKIFMILILIAFVTIIGIFLISSNNASADKISSSESATTKIETGSDSVRKSTKKAKADTSNMIKITDNYFIEATNDIYLNLEDYIGKTIKMEGLIYSYNDNNGDVCYAVVRNTPGCCGNDGLAGLDIRYDEEYPKEDTWVEVIGVIGKDTMYGNEIPAIQVSSIKEKEQGTTFVTN